MNQDLRNSITSAIDNNDINLIDSLHRELIGMDVIAAHNVIMSLKPLKNHNTVSPMIEPDYFNLFAILIKAEHSLFDNKQDIYRRFLAFSQRNDFFNVTLDAIEPFSLLQKEEIISTGIGAMVRKRIALYTT